MTMRKIFFGVLLAAALWFVMFSPWSAPHVNFWLMMSLSAATLTAYAFFFGGVPTLHFNAKNVLLGVALAVVLWGVFWVGNELSQLLFGFAKGQIQSIYAIKGDAPTAIIALLLGLLIGPAEELFWRAYIQKNLSERWGANVGFIVATLAYTLVHIWSLNFMLIMAALVCGVLWGGLYRLRPDWLPALIISHALWDVLAFVGVPFE